MVLLYRNLRFEEQRQVYIGGSDKSRMAQHIWRKTEGSAALPVELLDVSSSGEIASKITPVFFKLHGCSPVNRLVGQVRGTIMSVLRELLMGSQRPCHHGARTTGRTLQAELCICPITVSYSAEKQRQAKQQGFQIVGM